MQNDPPQTSSFPAQIYRDTVLAPIFADAQRLFLGPLIQIEYAHTLMLARQGILSLPIAASCLRAIRALDIEDLRRIAYDGTVEDLFFLVEGRIAALAGSDHAGRIHTARSRNDIDMTMYRMVIRERLLDILDAGQALRRQLVVLADRHRADLMPGYTHNQPAQPTTLGHYLMAMVEVLERDTERLIAAYHRLNRSPLGACAITTTGFPIDRHYTASLLGFNGLQVNSYGAIVSVDYITESAAALACMTLNIGRFTQDLILWSTVEFGYLRLSDGYVQISSIMPQKRNPVPLEHVRVLASRALNESQSVLNALHNTPFADMNDSEDSFQPLVALAFNDALRSVRLLTGVLSEAAFNTARMRDAAHKNFLSVTELADTIVRHTGYSFRHAHAIVSSAVAALEGDYEESHMAKLVQTLLATDSSHPIQIDRTILQQALNPENFVRIRTIMGGPAPAALDPEIARAYRQNDADQSNTDGLRDALQAAQRLLHSEMDSLLSQVAP